MEDHLITLGSFSLYKDYLLVKSKLESEGIEVFSEDNNPLMLDPGLANAFGGFRIRIVSSQVELARKVMETIHLSSMEPESEREISVGNRIFVETFGECPKCDSENIYYEKHSFFKSLFTNFMKREHYCRDCRHVWFQQINPD